MDGGTKNSSTPSFEGLQIFLSDSGVTRPTQRDVTHETRDKRSGIVSSPFLP